MKKLFYSLCILIINIAICTFSTFSQSIVPKAATGNCDKFNGVWCFKNDLNSTMLKACVSHQVFNIFLNVGYPKPSQYPTLIGIVPDHETGISVSKTQVDSYIKLLASVDSRLKLWAWFGTWSSLGTTDSNGHELGQVDVSTKSNRTAIIDALVDVAKWGFDGVQDDTEDFTPNSRLANGQFGPNQVDFWNDETIALHNIGVKVAIFTPAVWYNFNSMYLPQMKGMDYIISAGFWVSDTQPTFNTQMRQFLKNTKIPVAIDIQSSDAGDCAALISWIEGLPLSSYPNVIGFSLYEYNAFTSHSDWKAWDNWTTKNSTIPATPLIIQNGLLLTSNSATGNQWFLNDTLIQGATDQEYTAIKNGTYTVISSDNGCTSIPSLPVIILTVGITDRSINSSISVYPNPFSTSFTLKISSEMPLKNAEMKIFDVGGKEVKTISINNFETPVESGDMQSGMYFYNILNNKRIIENGKLVVQ